MTDYTIWRAGDLIRIENNTGGIVLTAEAALRLSADLNPPIVHPEGSPNTREGRRAELHRLYVDERMMPAEIARRWGLSRQAVASMLYYYKLPVHHPLMAEARKAEAAGRKARKAAE